MRISVRFFTTLREIAGKKEESLEFSHGEKATLKQILERLSKEYGPSFDEYVYDNVTGEIKGFLQFLVNGRSVVESEGMESPLSDGDVVAILPPVSGG